MGNGVEGYYLHEHGDNPLILRTADDMNRVIDELLDQDWEHDTVALYHRDHPRNVRGLPDHEFWLVVDPQTRTGALRYTGGRGAAGGTWFSKGDSGKSGTVLHYYMGSDNEYPADSEIPLDLVRTAAREFLESGGQRPTSVTWQPHWANAHG